jgi:hypothetical protein
VIVGRVVQADLLLSRDRHVRSFPGRRYFRLAGNWIPVLFLLGTFTFWLDDGCPGFAGFPAALLETSFGSAGNFHFLDR